MSDQNGHTVHKGESCDFIEGFLSAHKGRGLQGDSGHKGITLRGCKIRWNDNDGVGGESGRWLLFGNLIVDNGGNVDSRDGIQITSPDYFEIQGNVISDHHNAAIILNRLTRPGLVRWNWCRKARHGLAIELTFKGWPMRLLKSISQNTFEDCEYGIYLFGQKPKNVKDLDELYYKLNNQNQFINCKHTIFASWTH